jgi:hypothetical protein
MSEQIRKPAKHDLSEETMIGEAMVHQNRQKSGETMLHQKRQ